MSRRKLSRRSTGVEALRQATQRLDTTGATASPAFDLILMDLWMPLMDGYEAASRILSLHDDLAVRAPTIVAVTADGNVRRCGARGRKRHGEVYAQALHAQRPRAVDPRVLRASFGGGRDGVARRGRSGQEARHCSCSCLRLSSTAQCTSLLLSTLSSCRSS
ncbi:hypothetical protein MRB53_037655 [Persea americana]|nr:hypothetical protein MRB53_037655 [Persea americana]